MISKSRLTFLRALRQKKNRSELGLFVAEGQKLSLELLASTLKVKTIYATEKWLHENSKKADEADETIVVTDDELSRISSLVTPQEILVVAEIPQYKIDFSKLLKNYSLLLDGIRDPGNLGAIIRIADWFGIRDIICSPDSAEIWNPKVVQASMGSLIRVRVHEISPADFISQINKKADELQLPSPMIYGTFLNGKNIYKTDFSSSGIFVIGNESTGIRPETEALISEKITIPAWKTNNDLVGNPESLNAAIAAAIVCSEIRREK